MLVGAVTHCSVTAEQSRAEQGGSEWNEVQRVADRGTGKDRQSWTERRAGRCAGVGMGRGSRGLFLCGDYTNTTKWSSHSLRRWCLHSTANLLCGWMAQRWLTDTQWWHLDKVVPQQTGMQTHMYMETLTHTHTQRRTLAQQVLWVCVWRGSLCAVGPGWSVGTTARPQVQIRRKQEVWGNNTHRVMEPLNYSFVYHAFGSVGCVQNGACVYKLCVCMCALYCKHVDVCACAALHAPLHVPIYTYLFSRLCVSMNGFASVVSLLTNLSLKSNLHSFSMSHTHKKLELLSKVNSDPLHYCLHGWRPNTLKAMQ